MKINDNIKTPRRERRASELDFDSMHLPLLLDALEGFDEVEEDHAERIERMHRRLREQKHRRSKKQDKRHRFVVQLSIAATVVVLLMSGVLLVQNVYLVSDESVVAHIVPEVEVASDEDMVRDSSAEEELLAAEVAERKDQLGFKHPVIATEDSNERAFDDVYFSDELEVVLNISMKQPIPGSPMNQTLTMPVTGAITDAITGERLSGVTVVERGTNNVTFTDIDGVYLLSAPAGAELVVSYVGYQSSLITADGNRQDVPLSLNMNTLEEMVVVGYGVQKKQELIGSISVVKENPKKRKGNSSSSKTDNKSSQKTTETNVDSELIQPIVGTIRYRAEAKSGREVMLTFIRENKKTFYLPDGEKINGDVWIEFKVNEKGRAYDFKVLESVNKDIDADAIRLLKEIEWIYTQNVVDLRIEY